MLDDWCQKKSAVYGNNNNATLTTAGDVSV